MVDAQSEESDSRKRRHMVWAIEKKLANDDARPILFYNRAATCWQPYVKGLTLMVNSIYNDNRFEDLWLDKYPLSRRKIGSIRAQACCLLVEPGAKSGNRLCRRYRAVRKASQRAL
jgi:hypothetical protein